MDEKAIVESIKTGNEQAFQLLVTSYQNMVFNTVLGIVQQYEEAEDVAQEVFIQVYERIGSFRGEAKISTWIYRIATTKALDWHRKKKAKKRFGTIKEMLGFADKSEELKVPDFVHPGVQLEQKEDAAVLFKALNTIPEKQRTAFLLIKIEGLDYVAVAEIMQISVKAVEGLMHRAKEGLRKQLNDYYHQ